MGSGMVIEVPTSGSVVVAVVVAEELTSVTLVRVRYTNSYTIPATVMAKFYTAYVC